MWGETTRVENGGETTRGERPGETSWGETSCYHPHKQGENCDAICLNLNLNCLLVKRKNDNPSQAAVL